MRKIAIVGLLFLGGCSWFRPEPPPPPTQRITPGARIIYNGGIAVWVVCDKGNLIYMSENTPAISVIAGGCPTGSP